MTPTALWFVGLPGSGKSSLARAVLQALLAARPPEVPEAPDAHGAPVLLEMDERRKAYTPEPTYSDEERERAYAAFIDEAAALVAAGRFVLMDATAYRRAWRDMARRRIPGLAEVYVRCPLETAMLREERRPQGKVMAEMYAKALERQASGRGVPGLGQVVGVDVAFEEDPEAELIVDAARLTPEAAARLVLDMLTRDLPGRADASGKPNPDPRRDPRRDPA